MKLDMHVRTLYSGASTTRPLNRIMRESCDSVEGVYRHAKARGMGLVDITPTHVAALMPWVFCACLGAPEVA